MSAPLAVVHLFTDIEGSSRLWEQQRGAMMMASAAHFELSREAVKANHGRWVKQRGDGIHAVFDDPLDALNAMLALQRALADPAATAGMALSLRCGAHIGADVARDNDFYGPDVNRAARIADAGHGGQMLLSQPVADAVAGRLPAGVALRALGCMRLRDLTHAESIYQVLAPPLREDFPPLRSLEATPNNLPLQISRFIGREAESAAVRDLVARSRLITLFGTGGIGKSRLSMQVGAELLVDFPDGVWLVELAPLESGPSVALAVAGVLGVKEAAGQTLDEALLAHVRQRQLLLILDNCEHLLAPTAVLAKRLLQGAPKLKVIASSRELLHVVGEAVYPVPALSIPPPGGAGDLMTHESVRLFVDRACAVRPAFAVNAGNAAAVAEICYRLDGIPLAIELAAARARALSVEAMAKRLVDSFKLVSTEDQTVAPRQRTLRLLIDWSHQLLSDEEQVLFRRLSVFSGGFALEAAEVICADARLDRDDVAGRLTQLVDKSLVLADSDGSRYRMLETVRIYASEKLVEAGDLHTRQAHLNYFLAVAEDAHARAEGPEPGAWLPLLDRERANLLAAHAYSLHLADGAEWSIRLANALRRYWFNLGLLSQRVEMLQSSVKLPGLSPRQRAQSLFDIGQMYCFMGHNAQALTYLEECEAIARAEGDRAMLAWALQPMGMAAIGLGDRALARRCCAEGLALARSLDNHFEVACALNAMGQMERLEGRFDAAQQHYEEALAVGRASHYTEVVAIVLVNLAMIGIGQDTLDPRAPAMVGEALALGLAAELKPVLLGVLDAASGLALKTADLHHAALWHGAAQALMRQTGLRRDAADEAFVSPVIQHHGADPPDPAWTAAWQQGDATPLQSVCRMLGDWLRDRAAPA